MRYLILSDIHANLDALDAVLTAAPRDTFDRLLVLGDLVGYGANPNEVLQRVQQLAPDVIIRGNHDKVASELEDTEGFNATAAKAIRWTAEILTPSHRDYLKALPPGPHLVDGETEICHGAPHDEDAYVLDQLDALRALEAARRPVCFFGHTHVQGAFGLSDVGFEVTWPDEALVTTISVRPGTRYLINPGSVGQPRDGDKRAAWATWDTSKREVTLCRTPYSVDLAQRRILDAGLPSSLARRLDAGR